MPMIAMDPSSRNSQKQPIDPIPKPRIRQADTPNTRDLWNKVLAEAEGGDLYHMYLVGRSFSYGYPVEKDLHKAVDYLSKPAQNGHAESNLELAYICSELGDQQLAFKHFKAAADNNHPEAQSAVGEMYARGIGVEVNYPMAHKYLLEAANAGIAGAHQPQSPQSKERCRH